jgi:hypothetical protein
VAQLEIKVLQGPLDKLGTLDKSVRLEKPVLLEMSEIMGIPDPPDLLVFKEILE